MSSRVQNPPINNFENMNSNDSNNVKNVIYYVNFPENISENGAILSTNDLL